MLEFRKSQTALICRPKLNVNTCNSLFLQVLEDSLEWLNRWELASKKGDIKADEFLTRETAEGLRVTITSTMDMCRYIVEKFGFHYLLTGKVNHDNLEVTVHHQKQHLQRTN